MYDKELSMYVRISSYFNSKYDATLFANNYCGCKIKILKIG